MLISNYKNLHRTRCNQTKIFYTIEAQEATHKHEDTSDNYNVELILIFFIVIIAVVIVDEDEEADVRAHPILKRFGELPLNPFNTS